MAKQDNTSNIKTNSFTKGMVKDVTDLYQGEGVWTHARNAVNISHRGDIGAVGNEPGNILCTTATYDVIGVVYKGDSEWIIFSTNDTNSEIGIFNEARCEYTLIVNADCLAFKKTNLITGAFKDDKVYWQDNLNPDRFLDITDIPYTILYYLQDGDCEIPVYSTDLDCNRILLQELVTVPCVTISRANGSGQLINGSYQAAIAYSVGGTVVTTYIALSNVQSLFSHGGIGGSIQVDLTNVDAEFDEYELVLITTSNAQTVARRIGFYSTNHTKVTIDLINQANPIIPLAYIPLLPVVYNKSRRIDTINDYLLRIGVTAEADFNYQPLANEIVAKYVAVEYPASYYKKSGNKVGYMRDEVYSFFIRWIYNTSQRSASYHIPGRPSVGNDLIQGQPAQDVLPGEQYRWQVYNTAQVGVVPFPLQTTEDGGKLVGIGKMAYWESSERYPNNPEVWGDLCGAPIRHHKFPDGTQVGTSTHYNGGLSDADDKISIMGVRFENIAHPVDDQGVPIPNIIGYEILRGSREGNKSIVAKGLFNNMCESEVENEDFKRLHQNYPYNDCNPDPFLLKESAKTISLFTFRIQRIPGPPLDQYKREYYSFHSPDTTFQKPFLGGNYVNLYSIEYGESEGKFKFPYKHPKQKVITNDAFETAVKIGLGLGIIAAIGEMSTTSTPLVGKDHTRTGTSATALTDVAGLALAGFIVPIAVAVTSFITHFPLYVGGGTDQTLRLIYALIRERNYVVQFNSHGFYDHSQPLTEAAWGGKRRRTVVEAKYIDPYIQRFDKDYVINNLYRNRYVCVHTNGIFDYITSADVGNSGTNRYDNSKASMNMIANFPGSVDRFTLYEDPQSRTVKRLIASYYGALKVSYENQYGQIDSVIQIPTGCCIQDATNPDTLIRYTSDLIFGGDVYINRYTEKNPYFFFNKWLMGEGDNTDFNYKDHFNGPEPRYWADFKKYTVDDLNIRATNPSSLATGGAGIDYSLPDDYYELDIKRPTPTANILLTIMNFFAVTDGYMYLTYNGVRDFYVESEVNLAHRDYGDSIHEYFYDADTYTDIDELFRSDIIVKPNYYKYDYSLSASKTYNNFASWGKILPRDYTVADAYGKFRVFDNRVIYSLQHFQGLKKDNWRSYLANNYKDFVGKISSIKGLNQYGAVILFEDAEPVTFPGIDQIQTKAGASFAIGDGGLFAQALQSPVNADDSLEYGGCINARSAINTPHGLFWISQKNGKIMQYAGQVDVISRYGMSQWFAEYLPSQLLIQYPDFPLYDNPVLGVGCQAIYDSQLELVYFTKRDFKSKYPNDTYYDADAGTWKIDLSAINTPFIANISLTDTAYFEDCSWTVSYDPKAKAWVSFHDWHPHLMIPAHSHFITIKDNGFWKHNIRLDSYANYYGVNYPWEIEFAITSPDVTTLRSVEYILENYKFYNNQDFHQVLDHNFDRAILWNNEQISGLRELEAQAKNNPASRLQYPIVGLASIRNLYSKEENKYRINNLFDVTDNREEFNNLARRRMWNTQLNGYIRAINPIYVNYNKSIFQRKKFRHYGNRLLLRRNVSADIKMILIFSRIKELLSSR